MKRWSVDAGDTSLSMFVYAYASRAHLQAETVWTASVRSELAQEGADMNARLYWRRMGPEDMKTYAPPVHTNTHNLKHTRRRAHVRRVGLAPRRQTDLDAG